MTAFRLSENIDKNKVFLVNKSQIEKRLDPFYYVPELMELEEKVWQKNPQKLIHYAKAVSSGATPKTTESEKYYTDKENGIPFLRVQNLTSAGRLKLDNVKFINEETHNGMLARSKVKEGDLLIKITGVGRMAVSSVAPEDFEGNVNQHMVVMKTDSPETSKILAAFLNSDIGEKLASRRAAGGTRPALDYPALLSIPIIYDERILKITEAAVKKKETKEQQAKELLASIDYYLLGELGIKIPKKETTLQDRIFNVHFRDITGSRFDPFFMQNRYVEFFESIKTCKYPYKKLKELVSYLDYGLMPTQDYAFSEKEGLPMIRVTNIKENGYIDMNDTKYIPFDTPRLNQKIVRENDILMVQCGNTTGKCAMVSKEFEGFTFGSFSFGIRAYEKVVNQYYLFILLASQIAQKQLERSMTIASVRPNTSKPEVSNLLIPVPPLKKQAEIAKHIRQIREQAWQLQQEAERELEKASWEVEGLILQTKQIEVS